MASKRSPLTDALINALSLDEWRKRDDVVAELLVRVPPGKARRQYEYRAQVGGRPHLLDKPDDFKIRTGARELVNKTIGSAIAGKFVERKDVDGVRMLRRVARTAPAGMIQEEDLRKVIGDVLSGATGQLPLAFLMTPAQPRQELTEVLVNTIIGKDLKEQDGS